MANNRRRRLENNVPVGALFALAHDCRLALMGGMTWVYSKNQLFHRGQYIRSMEEELAGLSRKNEALAGGSPSSPRAPRCRNAWMRDSSR